MKTEPIFATSKTEGHLEQVDYTEDFHQANMKHLSEVSANLPGHGLKTLRTALLILAGLLLVAGAVLAAIPTAGLGFVAIGLGGAGLLTGGVGFFIGRDIELAGTVGNVQMNL